jgi:fibronectin type III domain protein
MPCSSARRLRLRTWMLVVAAVLVVPWLAPTAPEVEASSSRDHDTTSTTTTTEGCGADWSSADLIDTFEDDLPEVSGFVSSARYPGLAWMIRDSGNPDSLYSFRLDSDDHAAWEEFPVSGSASNHDWEDVTYSVGPDGQGRLWILENDSGNFDPEHSDLKLYEVLEPDPDRDQSARLAATYRFEYPGDENYDTEAIFALGGDLFAVTKTDPNRVFRFPDPLSRSDTNRLTEVGGLDASSLITAVGASGDERLLVTVGIGDQVRVFENQGFAAEFSGFDDKGPVFRKSMPETQREAIDFFPYEGCDIISVSEDGTVWRLSNPNTIHPAGRPGAPTAVRATAGDGSATVSWLPPIDTGGMITGYRVTAYQDATEMATVTTPDGAATSAVVTGLANGTAYTFTVTALNVSGAGPASAPSAPVTPAADPAPGRTPSGTDAGVAGYWMLDADGTVYPFGAARHFGDATADLHSEPAVDLEPTPSGGGYWVLDDRGRVHVHGDAGYFGDVDRSVLAAGEQVTSLSATPAADGYWIFTSRGRVQAFGAARHLGDMAKVKLNGPVLDSVATPTGAGYYMVAADGGIFTFGDAVFYGSMGAKKLNAPVQSLVPDGDGTGYWLVASDGGVFTFEAPFRGSLGSVRLNKPITGMVRFGNGYLMVGEDGGIFNFSDRPFSGSLGARPPATPVVAVAALD